MKKKSNNLLILYAKNYVKFKNINETGRL